MSVLGYLIPAALLLGLLGLGAFLWALKSGQFDDLDGAAMRILIDDEKNDPPPSEQADEQEGPHESPHANKDMNDDSVRRF
ncbi:MAG: cbb3-type cytochrome oxidase assembly protein CcoS [Rhodospirillales bacterium]